MASKRRRNTTTPDTQLIEIYEDLANEAEEIRLRAAHTLLSGFAQPASISAEKVQKITGRLFRGLCSSRKGARLGFSIALTEFLAQIFQSPSSAREAGLTHDNVLQTFYKQTLGDGTTSGQDERDHYFGRLFGAEAIVKSCILFRPNPSVSHWRDLVHFICSLALKKPWIRQECGWLLFTSIGYLQSSDLDPEFAVLLIEALKANNLVRTPEAVAVWLEVKACFPSAKLPKDIWKHRDPLHRDELAALAQVMRDAKAKQQPDASESAASQGTAVWSQQLHFSWDVLLRELYPTAASNAKASTKRMTWGGFWTNLVDESLFSLGSSPERKHWGFLLLAKVVATAPRDFLQHVFAPNTMVCLVHHLKVDERYLHRSAAKAVHTLQARASREPNVVAPAIKGLLLGNSGVFNFDATTKTKTIAKLLALGDMTTYQDLVSAIGSAMAHPLCPTAKQADIKRKALGDLLVIMCSQILSKIGDKGEDTMTTAEMVLDVLVSQAYFTKSFTLGDRGFEPPLGSECRTYLRSRLKTCLNQSLQRDPSDFRLLRLTVTRIRAAQKTLGGNHALLEFDSVTQAVVDTAWKKYGKLEKTLSSAKAPSTHLKASEVLRIFYSLAILQLYDEDPDAPGILQDLNSQESDLCRNASKSSETEGSGLIIEILLSFASKPAKFFHQACLQAFRGFSNQVSQADLQSLIRILGTKESSTGTQDLFDVQDEANDDVNGPVEQRHNGQSASQIDSASESDSNPNIDSEMLDSDVEELSAEGSFAEEQSASSEEDQAELDAFDAKLAAALGMRPGQMDLEAEAEGSDEDMYEEDMAEEEMQALDEQLAAVFRARKSVANKKQERKDTKEAIINFKKRVLDLVEIYLKQEQPSPFSLDLLLPLITTARQTSNKEIRNRAHEVLQGYCSKCKGSRVPPIDGSEVVRDDVLGTLQAVHEAAGLDGSRAHANACSKASILLVKTLLHAQVDIGRLVDVYAETRKKQLREKNCKIQPVFFTEWNNWCTSAREQLAS